MLLLIYFNAINFIYLCLLKIVKFEHFHSIGKKTVNSIYDEAMPQAARYVVGCHISSYIEVRGHLDRLTYSDLIWMSYQLHQIVRPFESISLFRGLIRYGVNIHRYKPDRVLDSLGMSRGFQILFCDMTVVFLRISTIGGYILLIIWSVVLPQLPSHMHAQLTTWIGLCVFLIHSLVLAMRRIDRMWHLELVLVVQLTQTHSPQQIRTMVQ